MIVTVTQRDFEQASGYAEPHSCPLAIALRRLYGKNKLRSGSQYILLRGKKEVFPFKGWTEDGGKLDAYMVQKYVHNAHAGFNVPTFEVFVDDRITKLKPLTKFQKFLDFFIPLKK